MKLYLFLFCSFLLSACTHYAVKQDDRDSLVYSISCSELNTKKDECRAKVEAMCTYGVARIIHYEEEYQDYADGIVEYPKHHYKIRCNAEQNKIIE